MAFSIEEVKKLRERTNAAVMDCKRALQETDGDIEKALKILKNKGSNIAEKKSGRTVQEGCIGCYVHSDAKLGVMVEVNCETDFVGRNPEFREFAKNIAMQIAAHNPEYISKDEIPDEIQKEQIEIIKSQMDLENKPEKVKEQIIKGKLNKYYEQVCLLEQVFIRDEDLTIKNYLEDTVSKFKENIKISKFKRYKIGE